MNRRASKNIAEIVAIRAVLLMTVIFCACRAFPQTQLQDQRLPSNGPQAPIQPLPPQAGSGAQADVDKSTTESGGVSQFQADDHLLYSGETLGLDSLHSLIRVFDPSLQLSQSAQTGTIPGQILSVSTLGGALNLAHGWRRYRLAFLYSGAETVYQPVYFGIRRLPYNRASISQDIFLGRWTLRLRDDVLESLGSGFTGLFTGGPPQIGQNGIVNNIQPLFVPSQTIETALVRQLNNTGLAEADYQLSRRSTVTVVGSYGLLHFFGPGYIDSSDIRGRFGYNYALSAKNNVAVAYDYDGTTFTGTRSRIQTDSAQVAFGRKLTGRMAFRLAAGPEWVHLQNFGTAKTTQISWNAFAELSYNLHRNSYSFSYSHLTTAGSGIFVGSQTDTLRAIASRQLTNSWSASLSGGYAVNRNLVPVPTIANRFDNWYAAARLDRQIKRQLSLGLNYEHAEQTNSGTGCAVVNCSLPGRTTQLGLILQWHPLKPGR